MRNIPDKNKGFPWKPWKGEWKVTKLPRNAGQTEPMTWDQYKKMHPDK